MYEQYCPVFIYVQTVLSRFYLRTNSTVPFLFMYKQYCPVLFLYEQYCPVCLYVQRTKGWVWDNYKQLTIVIHWLYWTIPN